MPSIVHFRHSFSNKCLRIAHYLFALPSSMMSATAAESKERLLDDFSRFKFSPFKLLNLPIEINRDNYTRRYIKEVAFSHVDPTPVASPKLVSFSEDVLTDILDLDPKVTQSKEFVEFISGNNVLASSTPLAHRYGGHQFGVWAMQLGDGRAILLGEYINRKGERWELQLKGAGKTPYSRSADGRAVLRSSIREFLCSEAMYYLGVPTSRAGALVVSEDKVMRDLLYDGHIIMEPAAVLLRLSPSWFRIGSLELPSTLGEHDLLKQLVLFIINEHFLELVEEDQNQMVTKFLKRVFRLNSELVVHWQTIGFTHGVLNTDNISLLGLTIDYGPFGFLENYDPMYVPNHSDHEARYCYGRQVQIMLFNLMKLYKALCPLLPDQFDVSSLIKDEADYIEEKILERFSFKLGFKESQPEIVGKLSELMEKTKSDFSMVFREMSETPLGLLDKLPEELWALKVLSSDPDYSVFINEYREKMIQSGVRDAERMEAMCNINPRYVLRNWMAQEAINEAEKNNYSEVERLLRVLKQPFTKQDEAEEKGFAGKPPKWSKTLCLSCSS